MRYFRTRLFLGYESNILAVLEGGREPTSKRIERFKPEVFYCEARHMCVVGSICRNEKDDLHVDSRVIEGISWLLLNPTLRAVLPHPTGEHWTLAGRLVAVYTRAYKLGLIHLMKRRTCPFPRATSCELESDSDYWCSMPEVF